MLPEIAAMMPLIQAYPIPPGIQAGQRNGGASIPDTQAGAKGAPGLLVLVQRPAVAGRIDGTSCVSLANRGNQLLIILNLF